MDFHNLLHNLRIDSTDVLRRFGNQQSILERFLLKFPDDPTMSSLKEAVEEHDAKNFELYAHTLKGVANNLGLQELGNICSKSVESVRNKELQEALHIFPSIQDEYFRIIEILENYKKES